MSSTKTTTASRGGNATKKQADKPMDPYEWYVLLDRATESINYIPNEGKNL